MWGWLWCLQARGFPLVLFENALRLSAHSRARETAVGTTSALMIFGFC
ncbi:hypothetical protein LEP1GSC032_1910 [Leptospira interrogans str. 2002000631]|nr:hypothetical protein LEP1GSC032_1910 [Leptospira interrogans str. 2002000631]